MYMGTYAMMYIWKSEFNWWNWSPLPPLCGFQELSTGVRTGSASTFACRAISLVPVSSFVFRYSLTYSFASLFYVWACVYEYECVCVCISVLLVDAGYRRDQKTSNPLDLEFQEIMSHHGSAGKGRNEGLLKTKKWSEPLRHHSILFFHF